MRLFFISFFLWVLNISLRAQGTNQLAKEIDTYFQTVALKDGFTGTLIVTHHGQPVIQKGYGLANRQRRQLNTEETLHNLGSSGSIFTEMSILILQEKSKLSVSDPICKYLALCPSSWKKITINHLLEQKSGLKDYLLKPGVEKNLGKLVKKSEMFARFAADTLEFSPGEKFNASATGYFLLGLIVEKVSGTSLASFIEKNIFTPLGMKRTRLIEPGTLRDAAEGYMVQGDSLELAPFVHPSLMFGYGNLYATAGDIIRWERSLYSNKVLTVKSVRQMDQRVASAFYGDKLEKMFGHTYYRYFKGTWGHRMHMLRFPEDSTVILLLTNNNSTKQDKFMRDIASMIYGTYVPAKEIKEVGLDSSILLRYVGNYSFAAGREVAITIENGKLHMQGTNRPRKELVAVSDNKFYIKGSEVYLEFKDTAGVISEMVLHEINTTITAKRKPQ